MKSFLRDICTTAIIAVVIFFGLQATVQSYVVEGSSMNPNFIDGQRLLVNKAVYKFLHEIRRGDVIIFHPPNQSWSAIPLIKRVIGLPGEWVELKGGIVYVHKKDGSTISLDEPYIFDPATHAYKTGIIPDNHYFVLGDNRNNSGDSREGWTVPYGSIIGKAWLSTWPPGEWGLAYNYSFKN